MSGTPPIQHVLSLGPFALESGALLPNLRMFGLQWGSPDRPAVVVVHALTGDARVAGPGGWWEPVCGPGRAIDTDRFSVVCFANLGSCQGSSGPDDPEFADLTSGAAWRSMNAPPTVTTWDQARALLRALDAVGIARAELIVGGSLGGMIALCAAALAPARFATVCPIAACQTASPWIIGFNHAAREVLRLSGLDGEAGRAGLAVARQIAHMTYRAEAGLQHRQGRAHPNAAGWSDLEPYAVETYLRHQGAKLAARFTPRAYWVQTLAMDHHDCGRPPRGEPDQSPDWSLRRWRGRFVVVSIDSDQLYLPTHSAALAAALAERRQQSEYRTITSPHGHDAFLIEWTQVESVLRQAILQSGTDADE